MGINQLLCSGYVPVPDTRPRPYGRPSQPYRC